MPTWNECEFLSKTPTAVWSIFGRAVINHENANQDEPSFRRARLNRLQGERHAFLIDIGMAQHNEMLYPGNLIKTCKVPYLKHFAHATPQGAGEWSLVLVHSLIGAGSFVIWLRGLVRNHSSQSQDDPLPPTALEAPCRSCRISQPASGSSALRGRALSPGQAAEDFSDRGSASDVPVSRSRKSSRSNLHLVERACAWTR